MAFLSLTEARHAAQACILVAAATVSPLTAQGPPTASDALTETTAPVLRPSIAPRPAILSITAVGLDAGDPVRALPIGATPVLRIAVRNGGPRPLSRIALSARLDGLRPEPSPGWRSQGEALISDIRRLAPGETIERELIVRVERAAPPPGSRGRVTLDATGGGHAASVEVALPTADCAGAYHARLGAIRLGPLKSAREEVERVRTPDRLWPRARQFPPSGGRVGPLANAERLAAYFLAEGGADHELGRDPLRMSFARWAGELSSYAGQGRNPALCSGANEMVARYRGVIEPFRRRLETVQAAALAALTAVRERTGQNNADLAGLIRDAVGKSDAVLNGEVPLLMLAQARSLGRERALTSEQLETLSLIETAAILAEPARRSERLAARIDETLTAITAAAAETCRCAY